jgi:probable rRNA maturation factor
VNVLLADEQDDPLETDVLLHLAELVLDREGVPPESEAAIVFVDEEQITELNRRHMGKSGPADVLSFPLEEASPGSPPRRSPGGPPVALGDVFIAPSVAARNADARGVEVNDELALLVVHGLLHLLGWDHGADVDADAMESRERELLLAIGRVRP